jgi:hypothetical protein
MNQNGNDGYLIVGTVDQIAFMGAITLAAEAWQSEQNARFVDRAVAEKLLNSVRTTPGTLFAECVARANTPEEMAHAQHYANLTGMKSGAYPRFIWDIWHPLWEIDFFKETPRNRKMSKDLRRMRTIAENNFKRALNKRAKKSGLFRSVIIDELDECMRRDIKEIHKIAAATGDFRNEVLISYRNHGNSAMRKILSDIKKSEMSKLKMSYGEGTEFFLQTGTLKVYNNDTNKVCEIIIEGFISSLTSHNSKNSENYKSNPEKFTAEVVEKLILPLIEEAKKSGENMKTGRNLMGVRVAAGKEFKSKPQIAECDNHIRYLDDLSQIFRRKF